MRDPRYQRLLNSREWQDTKRIVWQRAGGLCEECKSKGYIVPGKDCHHIHPISASMSDAEMRRLCFDARNIRLLCVPCHVAVHKEMGKGTKANRQERAEQAQARWMERYMKAEPLDGSETPPISFSSDPSPTPKSLCPLQH